MAESEDYRILIVEDDPHLVRMMQFLFMAKGFNAKIAQSGHEAFEILKDFTPHAFVLDIIMPSMDGFQVLEKIKLDDKLKDIPVLVLSALPSMGNSEKAMAMGASEYINKPFRSSELVARITAHIEKRNVSEG